MMFVSMVWAARNSATAAQTMTVEATCAPSFIDFMFW
jgi:hypothetical protein